jgi:uncharacterized membrane protein HdeD (DUF308 family)
MNKHENFWIATVFRGVLALVIGSGILVVPDLARTILFLPFAVAFVIVSLASYGVADSILVFITSSFTSLRPVRMELRLQGAFGVAIGVLFCSILFDRIRLEWFLYLIALQALATACSEFMIARHTSREHGSRWCYAAAGIALLCAVAYAIGGVLAPADMTPRAIALFAYAYLAAFGLAQTLMAMRMLALEHHAAQVEHGESQYLSRPL